MMSLLSGDFIPTNELKATPSSEFWLLTPDFSYLVYMPSRRYLTCVKGSSATWKSN